MIEIVGCLHAAVLVSKLERSIEFYEGILGLSRIDRSLNYPGAWYQIGDVQIHLIEDVNYQSPNIDPYRSGGSRFDCHQGTIARR
jgi:glyoxylase I family protein